MQKNWHVMIAECIKDMVSIAETGKWTLEAQVSSYDLFDRLSDGAIVPAEEKQAYLRVYAECSERLAEIFDAEVLKNEAQMLLSSCEEELNEQRFKAAAAASLHEFAKDTFAQWQTA